MSKTTFLIGCTHFGHDKMYKFIDIYGNKVRPFENAKEGDAGDAQTARSTLGVILE